MTRAHEGWQPTACILCSRNCGIEVQLDGSRFERVRGDQRHPISAGYLCQKAARLEHYQNHADRLTTPLRRRPDGSFEPITWEVAIAEVAERLVKMRDEHTGRSLAYYGGGGQGNHLGGVYGAALREAMGSPNYYSALAQEKTGDFWVNGKLFGRQTCHTTEDLEHADFALFIGTNPWQAHGIRNARDTVRALAKDPNRTMVVVDPRRTETADLADIHLQLRPGTDAWLLAAMLGVIVQEELEDRAFLKERAVGTDAVRAALREVPVADFAARAGVPEDQVRRVARGLARARAGCVRVDLGIQQTLNSTLNSYLEKLLFLLTGNFGRPGTNAFHTFLLPLIGHSDPPGAGGRTTAVTGFQEIAKLFPPNVLPAEIDTDHPERIRGLFVDSANPMVSGADTAAYRTAFAKLDLLVVVDVALTETARMAHYVLPAASQFEKWEATFFNLEFPTNFFHLRRPLLPPLGGTLPEPEIYRRLLVAMGALPRFPALRAIARLDRRWPRLRLFPAAFKSALAARPRLRPIAQMILYDTLGRALPDGAQAAAVLWGAAHIYATKHGDAVRRAGFRGTGPDLGEALFQAILEKPSGTPISTHTWEDTWRFLRHPDRRIHLEIPEMLDALKGLRDEQPPGSDERFPLVLAAGERRAYNANTIFRDPRWRKSDREGALKIHPDDAGRFGVLDGAFARCSSPWGEVQARVHVTDTVQPGLVSLPHGYGLDYPDAGGERVQNGPWINLLTGAAHRDPITATPYHKYVPVRVEPHPETNAAAK